MKSFKLIIIAFLFIFLIQFSSGLCNINPSLINQDPNPAVPGETVKVLIQLKGVENPECSTVIIEFLDEYPFSLDPGYTKLQTIQGGTYVRDFNSFWMIPYKLRVDENALDGDQPAKIRTGIISSSNLSKITEFNLTIEEVRTDFIITLDSYSFSTNKLVLGIVNIGEKNAQAITVEVPEQDNALTEGGHVKILGELDSNEDTTIMFDAILNSGPIKINLEYNVQIGVRRILTKEVLFSEVAFEGTRETSSISLTSIFLWLLVAGIIVYLFISRRRRIKARHRRHLENN